MTKITLKLLKSLGLTPKEIKRWKEQDGVEVFDRYPDSPIDKYLKDFEQTNIVSKSGEFTQWEGWWDLTLYLYRKGEKFAIRVDDYVTGGGSDSTVYLFQ